MYDHLPYRPSVGILVINDQQQVWMGARIPLPSHGPYQTLNWQFPQGGIEREEDPVQAAYRELFEETSMRNVELLGAHPDWISYDLPEHLLGVALYGKFRGQTQKWVAMRFHGDNDEVNIHTPGDGSEPAEFHDWRWCAPEQALSLALSYRRAVYMRVLEYFHSSFQAA